MKRVALLSIACLLALSWSGTTHASVAETVTELPFIFEQGHVILPIKIKKDVAVDVILATGYEHSVMDPTFLGKYKLPAYYSGVGPITGHNDQTVSFTTVEDLRVGEIKVASLNMLFRPLADVSKSVGREVFGVLGVDFFKGRIVQFDFGKRLVRFLPESPSVGTRDAGLTKNLRAPVVLPMRSSSDRLILPVADSVLIDGKKIRTLIDTGAVTTISLSPSAAKELGLAAPPEKSAPRIDKVGSLRFADIEITAVPVILFAKDSGFYRDLKEFEAIVGTVVLQNFVVTFDFRKHAVILERF